MKKVVLCWSGGKDSAMALHALRKEYEVVSLLTTVSEEFGRVSMHGIREELVKLQAEAIGLPLKIARVPAPNSNALYEKAMASALNQFLESGIDTVAFGDIFLEDLRRWREKQIGKLGMKTLFPLWKKDTRSLAQEFVDLGFKTIVCAAGDAHFDQQTVGMVFDKEFIANLSTGVDPCGENGEFHTFVTEGPIFSSPLAVQIGEKVYREIPDNGQTCCLDNDCDSNKTKKSSGIWFCDILSE